MPGRGGGCFCLCRPALRADAKPGGALAGMTKRTEVFRHKEEKWSHLFKVPKGHTIPPAVGFGLAAYFVMSPTISDVRYQRDGLKEEYGTDPRQKLARSWTVGVFLTFLGENFDGSFVELQPKCPKWLIQVKPTSSSDDARIPDAS